MVASRAKAIVKRILPRHLTCRFAEADCRLATLG